MENKEPIYCMHCKKWYANTKADQCDIAKEEVPCLGSEAIGFNVIETKSYYGHPSELNANHDCSHYEAIGFFGRIGRKFMDGIPMKPNLESEINTDLQPSN